MSTETQTSPPDPPRASTRPPTQVEQLWDKAFRGTTWLLGWGAVVLLLLLVFEIGSSALPHFQKDGLAPLTSTEWNPSHVRVERDADGENTEIEDPKFGIAGPVFGTVYSSVLALLIATILGVAVAIFITEDFLPPTWRLIMKNIIELLAAIPSVIYGLWGFYVLSPMLQSLMAFNPTWQNNFNGSTGILPAALILAIMILPTITALSINAINNVPPRLREGAIGLGATRWETIFKITLPTASTGIVGAVMLGFGRALGETMALAILMGGKNVITWNILSPGNTLAALLANDFPEALTRQEFIAALMYAAIVLLIITLIVNILGSAIMYQASKKLKGLH